MSTTLQSVLDRAGVDTLGVLDAQIDIPILTGTQAQGDLLIVPAHPAAPATTPVPAAGTAVVAPDTGNRHTVHAWDGQVLCDVHDTDGGVLATITVPAGSSAMLVHTEEHGANGLGEGTYHVRGQAEQADETARSVAD